MKALTERHVQAIWYDAALRPPRLVTRGGEPVAVVSPGEWNLGAGPDFRNAVLELGPARRRVSGDVEIHLAPGDWDFHGHGADPRYRNVIAHVTWGCGPEARSLPPTAVSIWLGRFVTGDPSFSPDAIDLSAYPYARLPLGARPCETDVGRDPELARRVLTAAGRHRLRMKARRLVGRTCEAVARAADGLARRQVFYEEVMTAFGYSRNAAPFRRVAERIPLACLPDETAAAQTAFLSAGSFEAWNRTGLRPHNQPERRLEAAAAVFSETDVMALAETDDFSPQACRAMVNALCAGRHLGRGRAAAVVANVVVPFALAEGRLAEVPDWLPPEDVPEVVRLTAGRLFGRDHNPPALYSGNGVLIQGVLEVARTYCGRVHPDCAACALASDYAAARRGEVPGRTS